MEQNSGKNSKTAVIWQKTLTHLEIVYLHRTCVLLFWKKKISIFFSIFIFCPKIDKKYTPVFFPYSPLSMPLILAVQLVNKVAWRFWTNAPNMENKREKNPRTKEYNFLIWFQRPKEHNKPRPKEHKNPRPKEHNNQRTKEYKNLRTKEHKNPRPKEHKNPIPKEHKESKI